MYSARTGFPPDPVVALNDSTFASGANRLVFEREPSGKFHVRATPPEGESLTYAKVK